MVGLRLGAMLVVDVLRASGDGHTIVSPAAVIGNPEIRFLGLTRQSKGRSLKWYVWGRAAGGEGGTTAVQCLGLAAFCPSFFGFP